MEISEIAGFMEREGVEIVDLKFTDLLGTWQHFSIGTSHLDEGAFRDGVGFDGSSIRAFQGIERSDMVLLPDPSMPARARCCSRCSITSRRELQFTT